MTLKSFLPILILSVFTTTLTAQIAKQNLIIGGGAILQFNTTTNSNNITGEKFSDTDAFIFIGPSINYFVSDRLAVGGSLLVSSIANTGGNFGLTGDARFYLSSDADGGWFLTGQLGFITGNSVEQFSANGGIGYDAFISPNIAWESTITAGFVDTDDIIGNTSQLLLNTGLKFFFDRFPEELPEYRNGIIKKGNTFRGISSGSIVVNRRNNATISLINLQPSFGKFITDQFLFGANISLTNQSSNGFNAFSTQVTPFLRYYLNPAGKKIAPFGEIGGGVNFALQSGDFVPGQNQTQTSPIIFGNIGFDYFIRPAIAFEAKFGYRYLRFSDTVKQSSTGLTLGLQFFLDRG